MGYDPQVLASALFKIATSPADLADARRAGSSRALMVEPRAGNLEEIAFLRRFDTDGSGDIGPDELAALREHDTAISFAQRVREVFSTHPLAAKRFKRLADMRVP
jgi:Zn-dependent protease with chaperone function